MIKKGRKKFFILVGAVFFLAIAAHFSFFQRAPKANRIEQAEGIAGELFGVPVPEGNYYFAMRVAATFNTPWGGIPRDREQVEERTWTDLLMSYKAFERGIEVSQQEVEEEISSTIEGGGADFDWRQDEQAYHDWVENNLGVTARVFENQIRHLVQLKKLHNQILDNIEPEVTEEEAFQRFLDDYNTLSVELAQFDDKEEAKRFYQKVKEDSQLWEKESEEDQKKPREEQRFRRPGFVALGFLMHMWRFPRQAVYEMIEKEPGYIHPPAPIYRGYGVFKVIEIRRADEELFPERRQQYFQRIESQKKRQGFQQWLKDLKQEANIKKYIEPPKEIFREPQD